MEVTLAKTAGFCFGVRRAVDTVYTQIEKSDRPIYTFGPIIHNEEVVKDLEQKGVQVINHISQLAGLEPGIVIIRSHGVSRQTIQAIEEAGFETIDATCPFVKKIHRIVEEESRQGKQIVIIGSDTHPEVEGIKGWVSENTSAVVIEKEEEARNFHNLDTNSVCIVSQTTFNYNKFKDLVEILSKKGYDISVLNTICNATEERQTEAAKLAACSDVMIVIGGRHSSNTQKLFEICKKECENTYYIQTLSDLDLKNLPGHEPGTTQKQKSVRNVGITAGASTPNNIIQEVLEECQKNLTWS